MDTRTKRTVAKDRAVVAEQRFLDTEKQKSSTHIQLIAHEQKQIAKRLLSRLNHDHSLNTGSRSISEDSLHAIDRNISLNDASTINQSKSSANLSHKSRKIIFIPTAESLPRRRSTCSDGTTSDNQAVASDTENSIEEDDEETNRKLRKKTTSQAPAITVISPEENVLVLR